MFTIQNNMKKAALLFLLALLTIYSISQNSPACDSLVIDCCSFDVSGNAVSLVASNYSAYLFDYPGFILFNTLMDTVAVEEVNYFGIGLSQTHVLEIIHPFSLPFTGILELHTLFYDTLWCTFNVFIPDTTVTAIPENAEPQVHVYPNPANGNFRVDVLNSDTSEPYLLEIFNLTGERIYAEEILSPNCQPDIGTDREQGIYSIRVTGKNGNNVFSTKLIIR